VITRADVVAALAKLPQLAPSDTQPPVLSAGAAWPRWDHSEYANRCVEKLTWEVLVVLPGGDPATTANAGDALRPDVAAALFAIPAWVERCDPVQVQAEDGGAAVPALQFTISE
jgi:hypothetical protein